MTVTITGTINDVTARKDSRPWRVWSPVYRQGPGGEIVTVTPQPVKVVAGVVTIKLEPGPAVIENPDGQRYTVTVPDEDADLWDIISAAVAFPPDTAAEALASAVTTYLEDNPSRIKPRVTAVASSATPSLAGDTYDHFNLTSQAVAITSVTMTGTPSDGEMKTVRIKDSGSPLAIAWGSAFTGTLLTTTIAGKTHTQRLIWDAAASKWAGIYADTSGY